MSQSAGQPGPAPRLGGFAQDAEGQEVLRALLASDAGRADPYPLYRLLRERWPRLETAFGLGVVSRYADVEAVLREPRLGRGGRFERRREALGSPGAPAGEEDYLRREVTTMLFADPPEHTRLRRIVSRSFTPQRVEGLREQVRAVADQLLECLDGEVEMIRAFALPLPVLVIGALLGVPEADRLGLQPHVRAIARTLEPLFDDETVAEAELARNALDAYFREQIRDRERHDRPDLLGAMVRDAAQRRGTPEALSEDEVVGTAILLFAAGFETTTNLIGNGLHALLGVPEELERWRRDPTLSRRAVEELLRFDSPAQVNVRRALSDTEIDGMVLPEGRLVLTLVGAANRDPSRFSEPDRLDLGRDEGPHLAFGFGIHHCLGAPLARLEAEEAFVRLLSRFPVIEMAGEARWRPSISLRGLESLPVRLRR